MTVYPGHNLPQGPLKVKIRRGVPSDLAQVQRLNKLHYDYENSQGFYLDDSLNLNWTYSEAGAKFFLDHLDSDPASIVFLAHLGNKPIGYAIARYSSAVYRSQNPIAELEIMFVEEAHRGKGVGTTLMNAFKKWATGAHVARLRVTAFTDNHSAHDFYRKSGFVDFVITLEQPLTN